MIFVRRNYKLSATVVRDGALSIPVKTVLDIGAGPNLIRKKRIDLAWPSHIRPVQITRLLDASKRVMKFCGLIHLTVRIRRSQAKCDIIE